MCGHTLYRTGIQNHEMIQRSLFKARYDGFEPDRKASQSMVEVLPRAAVYSTQQQLLLSCGYRWRYQLDGQKPSIPRHAPSGWG
jgi:hypothetical protein